MQDYSLARLFFGKKVRNVRLQNYIKTLNCKPFSAMNIYSFCHLFPLFPPLLQTSPDDTLIMPVWAPNKSFIEKQSKFSRTGNNWRYKKPPSTCRHDNRGRFFVSLLQNSIIMHFVEKLQQRLHIFLNTQFIVYCLLLSKKEKAPFWRLFCCLHSSPVSPLNI